MANVAPNGSYVVTSLVDVNGTATIESVSATEGTEASVTNTGTQQNAILEFTLPKGNQGLSIYHIASELNVGEEATTDVTLNEFTVPTGYTVSVGDLVLDENGVVGQVYSIEDSTYTIRYLQTLKNGGTGVSYRHNIALYIDRDDMDCCALSFTLINQDSDTNYAIPTGVTHAVSGIVYPNSSTAFVATRLTVNTSGDDTIYTVGYWDYPNANQLTYEFTSNDTVLIEQTVETLDVGGSSAEYTAGSGISISDNTISVNTTSASTSSVAIAQYITGVTLSTVSDTVTTFSETAGIYTHALNVVTSAASGVFRVVVNLPVSTEITADNFISLLYNYKQLVNIGIATATTYPIAVFRITSSTACTIYVLRNTTTNAFSSATTINGVST